jgi:hypothetical protein
MKFCINGYPVYLELMDQMFEGHTIDGSTAYHPSASEPVNLDKDNSDDQVGEEDDQVTPMSIGNKRASSTSTIASSPSGRSTSSKRSKSPAVRAMTSQMTTHSELSLQKFAFMREAHEHRIKMHERLLSCPTLKINEVTRIAQEMGISADTPTLWDGLHNLVHDEVDMDFFLATKGDVERMCIIERATQEPPLRVDN